MSKLNRKKFLGKNATKFNANLGTKKKISVIYSTLFHLPLHQITDSTVSEDAGIEHIQLRFRHLQSDALTMPLARSVLNKLLMISSPYKYPNTIPFRSMKINFPLIKYQ